MKLNLISIPLIAGFSLISCGSFAEGLLTSLKVKNDIVYFSTDEAKTTQSPACMATENSNKWAMSLNTATGRAVYALLVTANADNRKVSVESANDCIDVGDFERAAGLEISPLIAGNQTNANALYLYKADGITKAGRFVEKFESRRTTPVNRFWYLANDNPTTLQLYTPNAGQTTVYFKSSDCTGEAYTTKAGEGRNIFINEGKFFTRGEPDGTGMRSRLFYDGTCTQTTSGSGNLLYKLDFTYRNPLCGEHVCILKEG